MDHIYLDLFGRQLDQRITQGLDRAIHVTFHNYVQFLEVT